MRTLFSIWLRDQSEKLGLSNESLAESANCSLDLLNAIESGTGHPDRALAEKLARIFDVPEDQHPNFILFAVSDLDAPTAGYDHRAVSADIDRELPWRTHVHPPTNLPAQLTTFVGRDEIVENLSALLAGPNVRLLTLLGPPGIGKTRLSIQVATRLLDDFEDGVFFIPLAPVTDHTHVAEAIAQSLGIKETSNRSASELVTDFLSPKQMILVLDNFEQVVEAGPFVTELLVASPLLKVLVTSRFDLHLYGEHVYRLPPLVLPQSGPDLTADTLSVSEASQLFVQRAQSAQPDFRVDGETAAAIAAICRKLDGLPLAIELAAARTNVLSPAGILARLDHRLQLLTAGPRNLPPRQQTLRGALDWSYDLLSEKEKTLFRLLSVFVGGCTMEAVERIWEMSQQANPAFQYSPSEQLDLITSLLDKSLLRHEIGPQGEPRFVLLETIREYGLEKLEEAGNEQAVRRIHTAYMIERAEQAEPHLTAADRDPWLLVLDAELDNFRAALAWSLSDSGDREYGLRLAGALNWFWYFSNHVREGHKWLTELLSPPDTPSAVEIRAKALYAAGWMTRFLGDLEGAISLLEESVSLRRNTSDRRVLAYALAELGLAEAISRKPSATAFSSESVSLFRQVGDIWGLALALDYQGDVENLSGNPTRGDELYSESLVLFRELKDKWGIAAELGQLGNAALRSGDYEAAQNCINEALAIERVKRDKWNVAHLLRSLGMILQHQGEYAKAINLYEESLAAYREIGDRKNMAAALLSLGNLAQIQGHYQRAVALYQEAITLPGRYEGNKTVGLCCAGLARIASIHNQWEQAVLLFAAADTLSKDFLKDVTQVNAYLKYSRFLARARARLGKTASGVAWAKGHAMNLEQIKAMALKFDVALKQTKRPSRVSAANEPSSIQHTDLSKRELELLRLTAQGLSNIEIAERLLLSPNTVRAHLYSIYAKIDVTSRAAATHFAIKNKLL